MTEKTWWERWPDIFERELEALDEAGIKYSVDEGAHKKGVLCLHLEMETAGKLYVVFPDLYPYFRFEVYAPEIQLDHHQNPFDKNLCLIGRSTYNWNTEDTLASFLTERLSQTIQAGSSNNLEEVAEIEEHQAEPFSDYYKYEVGTAVIVDSSWTIDDQYKFGTLLIGVAFSDVPLLRGAVFEVRDENGNTLAKSDTRLMQAFSEDAPLLARWVRLSEAPRTQNPADIFECIRKKDPYPDNIESYFLKMGKLQVRAALFPDERRWRELKYGWIFVCKLKPTSWEINRKKQKTRNRRRRGK